MNVYVAERHARHDDRRRRALDALRRQRRDPRRGARARTPTWSCATTTAGCCELCGRDCLGYSTSIGRPADGHSEILLRSNLDGRPAAAVGLGRRARARARARPAPPQRPQLLGDVAARVRHRLRAVAGRQPADRRRSWPACPRPPTSTSPPACTAAPRRRATRAATNVPGVIASRLSGFGTTIFTEMSALAERTGAINLGQGFPDEDGPAEVLEAAQAAIRDGRNQYAPLPGVPALRAGDRRAPAALLRDRARPGERGAGDDGRHRGDHRRGARPVRARRRRARVRPHLRLLRGGRDDDRRAARAGAAAPAGVDVRRRRAAPPRSRRARARSSSTRRTTRPAACSRRAELRADRGPSSASTT